MTEGGARQASPHQAPPSIARAPRRPDAEALATRRRQAGLQRMRIAAAIYGGSILLQTLLVALGMAPALSSALLCAAMLAAHLTFYALIRSGVTQRLTDPALTREQLIVAVLALCASYHINSSIRGLVLMGVVQILFFAAFVLTEAQCRQLSLVALLLVAASCLTGVARDPLTFIPLQELATVLFAGMILSTGGILAGELCCLRTQLKRQKQELQSAVDRLDVVAKCDGLTGLLNRRAIFDWLELEHRASSLSGRALCIALIDIDGFERLNEAWGYDRGDLVLQSFASTCGRVLRSSDRVARWGGDEFLLVMHAQELSDGAAVIDRIRDELSQEPAWSQNLADHATFSAGLAIVGDEPEALAAALHVAAERLGQAKALGRGQVCAEATR